MHFNLLLAPFRHHVGCFLFYNTPNQHDAEVSASDLATELLVQSGRLTDFIQKDYGTTYLQINLSANRASFLDQLEQGRYAEKENHRKIKAPGVAGKPHQKISTTICN